MLRDLTFPMEPAGIGRFKANDSDSLPEVQYQNSSNQWTMKRGYRRTYVPFTSKLVSIPYHYQLPRS